MNRGPVGRVMARALLLGGLCLAGASAPALAQVAETKAETEAGERRRLADERAAVEARFREREAECQHRFAVTDCVNDAKKERRNALVPIGRNEAALDDAQRKQRAAQRREDVRRKTEALQARDNDVVIRQAPTPKAARQARAEADATAVKPPREVRPPPVPKRAGTRPVAQGPTPAERQAREADAQARTAARKQAAQDHREAVERRNEQRALRGKRADPLPVPASGALP